MFSIRYLHDHKDIYVVRQTMYLIRLKSMLEFQKALHQSVSSTPVVYNVTGHICITFIYLYKENWMRYLEGIFLHVFRNEALRNYDHRCLIQKIFLCESSLSG